MTPLKMFAIGFCLFCIVVTVGTLQLAKLIVKLRAERDALMTKNKENADALQRCTFQLIKTYSDKAAMEQEVALQKTKAVAATEENVVLQAKVNMLESQVNTAEEFLIELSRRSI